MNTGLFSDVSCGLNCWLAIEEKCVCYCIGANHGVLTAGGKMPDRMSKIDGVMYKLVGFDTYFNYSLLREKAKKINNTAISGTYANYVYHYNETEKGAPMRIKRATKSQEAWTEIKELIGKAQSYGDKAIYLLWAKIEPTKEA